MSTRTDALDPEAGTEVPTQVQVFTPDFLSAVRDLDGVSTMGEAERSRPLSIVPNRPGVWDVVAVGSEEGVLGRFTDKEMATLFCAAYPTAERDVVLEFGSDRVDGWFPLWWTRGRRRDKCGELPVFDAETIDAMKSLLCLASNPVYLSYLLEFAGWRTLEAAADLLVRRLQQEGCMPTRGGAS